MGWKIYSSNSGGKNYYMIFTETELKGSFIIDLEKVEDERGFFSRSWDQNEFEQIGLNSKLVQCNVSFNKKKGYD